MMYNKLTTQLKETLITLISAILSLALFSIIIGWNLPTLFLFWFIIIPALAYKLPKMLSKKAHYLKQSVIGLAIFYAVMIFMIYDHYQTDYFMVMIISFFINVGSVFLVTWAKKQ